MKRNKILGVDISAEELDKLADSKKVYIRSSV